MAGLEAMVAALAFSDSSRGITLLVTVGGVEKSNGWMRDAGRGMHEKDARAGDQRNSRAPDKKSEH